MVGLVNSAGAYAAGREQAALSTRPATATRRDLGEPPMWVRPHEPERPNRDTAQAVAPTPPRPDAPAGDPPANPAHEAARVEGAAATASALGHVIDIVG